MRRRHRVASDQRIDLSRQHLLVDVQGETFERATRCGFSFHFLFGLGALGVAIGNLGHAMRNIVDHVKPGHALLVQEEHGV